MGAGIHTHVDGRLSVGSVSENYRQSIRYANDNLAAADGRSIKILFRHLRPAQSPDTGGFHENELCKRGLPTTALR